MTDIDVFIEDFLKHRSPYDPVAAREYYLRTRKLKGRKAGSPVKTDPRANRMYNGKPLKKLGQRIEEDETPDVSPTGAKLLDYDGTGLGKGTYADGYVYDPKVGWKKGGQDAAKAATAERVKNMPVRTRRVSEAESKLIRIRTLTKKIKDPKVKAEALRKLRIAENKLRKIESTMPKREKVKYADGSTVSYDGDKEVGTTPPNKKKGSSAKPVLRRNPA